MDYNKLWFLTVWLPLSVFFNSSYFINCFFFKTSPKRCEIGLLNLFFSTGYSFLGHFTEWQELGHQVNIIHGIAEKVFSEMDASISFKVGTMIEIPRAALVADEV